MSMLMEIIEWMDPAGEEIIHRIPQEGSADFKLGAQLIVRDSQLTAVSRMDTRATRLPLAVTRSRHSIFRS